MLATLSFDVLPSADLVTQTYGCTDNAYEWLVPQSWCNSQRFHSGIDLGSTHGGNSICRTPVYATRAGTVLRVGFPNGLGLQCVFLLTDSGVTLVYGHLDESRVQAGEQVKVGDVIGLLGTRGNSTACHLHLEARTDGAYQSASNTIDPQPYLTAAVIKKERIDMWLAQSSELGPDQNPLVFAVGESGKRHLTGPEFTAAKAAGVPIQPMQAADLAQIPTVGTAATAAIPSGTTLTLKVE